jgi:TrmH family RNA methyltransferase
LLRVADALYGELASTVAPQPVMAVVGKPVAARDFSAAVSAVAARKGKDANALAILVLDRIQDPGNVGTAIRTALAAGFDLVAAVKGTADLWSDKVIRGAAGSLFRMTVVEGLRTEDCIGGIRGVGAALCVCAADGEDCFSSDLSGGCALVVGNESGGASQAFMDNADRIVGIPMEKGAESLNAAVAAAIIMYEKRRQDSVRADGCRTS